MWTDHIGIFIAALGSLFILTAAFGAYRMPDLFTRMHASTKAATLGLSLTFIAAGFHFANMEVIAKSFIGMVFISLTAPVAAHALARSYYFLRVKPWEGTLVDELKEEIHRSDLSKTPRLQDTESKPEGPLA